jgi:midasin (ATPase involved in ribosome maturation)
MPKLDLAAYKYPTGTIIANRAVTVNGDYKKIAYIPDEMPDTVKWYVKRITPTMKAYVSRFVKPLKDKKPIQNSPIAQNSNNEDLIKKLESQKSKLIIKAFKQFPASPAQLKTRDEIDKLNEEIKALKK